MNRLLFVFAAIAVFGMFSGSMEPVIGPLRGRAVESTLHALHNGNSIVFNLSIGYLTSFLFWLLVVEFPERRRRRLLRNNLARQYQYFKESVVRILLWCCVGTHGSDLSNQLCDHVRFRAYFDVNQKERWYAALNGLQGQPHHLQDLLFEMELLAAEVAYVLNNVSISDEQVHRSLKLLNEQVHRLKNSSVYSSDPVKYVSSFIWGILARWSFVEGQQQDDFIEEMIKKI